MSKETEPEDIAPEDNESYCYDKYHGCENCPYVEECVDDCGYTYDDECGVCPEEFNYMANLEDGD